MIRISAISDALLAKNIHIGGLQWFITFQPLPRVFVDRSLERGGNILGLDREQGNNIRLSPHALHLIPSLCSPRVKTHPLIPTSLVFSFQFVWDSASDDAAIYAAADELLAQAKAVTQELGTARDYIYLNYAYPKQDPIGSYGAENVRLLKKASDKYDPKGVFQKLLPGGFKVSKVRRGY